MKEKEVKTKEWFINFSSLIFDISSALEDVSFSLHSPDKYNQSFSGGICPLSKNERWYVYLSEDSFKFYDDRLLVASLRSSNLFEIIKWINQNIKEKHERKNRKKRST